MIENKVANHVCDTCGSKLFVAASDTISIYYPFFGMNLKNMEVAPTAILSVPPARS